MKIVKPVAYKREVKKIETYKKNLALGKVKENKTIEKLDKELSKYITKKGELRKNLSQKKINEFNKLLQDYKEKQQPVREEQRQKRAEQKKRKKRINTAEKRGTYTKEESRKILNTFKSEAVRELSKKGILDSDQVMTLMKEFRFGNNAVSKKDFEKVAKYIIEQKENVPNEVSGLVTQDDTFMLAEKMLKDINKIQFD